MNILLNLKVLALEEEIRKNPIQGLKETAPSFRSLLIHYDNLLIDTEEMTARLKALEQHIPPVDKIELPSRLIEVPAVYNDRWTRECSESYSKSIKPIEPNCELVAKFNGLRDVGELIEIHSSTQYWVAMISFTPGLTEALPLDPRSVLQGPKYNPPRTWTYPGTVGLGGGDSCIYSVRNPGGYQMLGRVPLKIYDAKQSHKIFKDSPVLFRNGDRFKLIPINEDEFVEIEKKVEEGEYRHKITPYTTFNVKRYLEFLDDIKEKVQEIRKKNPQRMGRYMG